MVEFFGIKCVVMVFSFISISGSRISDRLNLKDGILFLLRCGLLMLLGICSLM